MARFLVTVTSIISVQARLVGELEFSGDFVREVFSPPKNCEAGDIILDIDITRYPAQGLFLVGHSHPGWLSHPKPLKTGWHRTLEGGQWMPPKDLDHAPCK